MKTIIALSALLVLIQTSSCSKSDYKNQIEKNLNAMAEKGLWQISSGWYYLFNGSIETGSIQDSVHYEFCTMGNLRVSDTSLTYHFAGAPDIIYSGKVIYIQFKDVLEDPYGNSAVDQNSSITLVNILDPFGQQLWGPEDFTAIKNEPSGAVAYGYYTVDVRKVRKEHYMMSLNQSYSSGGVKDEMVLQLNQ